MVKKLYFMQLKRCDKNSARYKVIRKNTIPVILNKEDEVLVKGGIIHEHTFQECADGRYKLYVKCHKMRKNSDATLYQIKVNTAGKPELTRL